MLLKSEKTRIMQEYARFEGDTGSPEVQIDSINCTYQSVD